MTRLPAPGGDDGTWGDVLNDYLSVELNSNGTLKKAGDITTALNTANSAASTANSAQSTAASAVQSVNSKTGNAISLALDDLSNVNTSGVSPGQALVRNGSNWTPSSVITSSGASTAKAQIPIASASSSNAINWQSKTIFDVRDYGVVGDGTTDDTAAFQTALNASNAANGELYVTPGLTVKLAGTVLLSSPTVHELRITGGGRGSVILDANTTGPCLRYVEGGTQGGRVTLKGLTFKLGVQKAAYNMVELVNLCTSDFLVSDVDFEGDATVNFYKCNAAIYMQDMWEGIFISCRWRNLIGHPIWYVCPTYNGGNVKWDSCQFIENSSGCYFAGSHTTNNLLFDNSKWVAASGYEFYNQLTSGIPTVGASTIQLPTGAASQYFPANGAVVLYSAAGMEVVHCATSSPYNSSTGVLTLRDTVALSHSTYSDLRVISCNHWSVIANFRTPSLLFSCCHFEQSPAILKDAPGSRFDDCEISISQLAYTDQARGVYLGGPAAEGYTFKNNMFEHPTGANSGNAMVFGMTPAPSTTSGTPSVEIDGVNTYPIGQAGMAQALWLPLAGDTTYMTFAPKRVVSSLSRGTERMTVPGYNAWNVSRSITATYSMVYSDDIILADATTGTLTVNLIRTANKTVRIKKIDSSANAITIVAGSTATIDGAASIQLTTQYQTAVLNYDGTNFWKV